MTVALAVVAFQLPKSPNSLCVQVASHAAKNVVIYPTAPEKVDDCFIFRTTSVQSCVSVIAGAVVFEPRAI